MRVFVAENCYEHTPIELVSGKTSNYQSPIKKQLFTQVGNLNLCDVVLIPNDSYHFKNYPAYIAYITELAKFKLVIYSNRGDFPTNFKIHNTVELRVAINPGESSANKIIVPYNVEPLHDLPLRKYQRLPNISFMGFIPRISPQRIAKSIKQSPLHPLKGNGAIVRHLLQVRANRSELGIEFEARKQYGITKSGSPLQNKNRLEYLEQISDNDLIFSPRGDANQSARLYEVLSAGRIPVIPNSMIMYPKALRKELNRVAIEVPLLFGNLAKPINAFWGGIQYAHEYEKLQIFIRNFFSTHLEFNQFFSKFFSLSIDEIKKLAG